MKIGAPVFHLEYGRGTIVESWGSWWACRKCYGKVEPPGGGTSHCAYCRGEQLVMRIAAKDVYEVRFGHEVIPVNAIHLRLLIKEKKKRVKKRGPRGPYKRRNYEAEYQAMQKAKK